MELLHPHCAGLDLHKETVVACILFDANSHLYTVTYAQTHLSLKLIPGRGLVDPHDPTAIVFQRTH
jgi:hypothetical protein